MSATRVAAPTGLLAEHDGATHRGADLAGPLAKDPTRVTQLLEA